MSHTAAVRRAPLRLLVVTAAVLAMALTTLTTPADAQGPEEPVWSSTWIDTPDGETLFVDVLHPADMPAESGPRPVLLVASPYLGDEGGTTWTRRFEDFFLGAYDGEGIFANGWSVVQVHLRGTSGSTGCLDILGPGEQTDILTGIEWINAQPWADGVAMYGKSYDANTGAAALANNPPGLDAVIAQAIGPDRYRAAHNDRVRLIQSLIYPNATYGLSAEANFHSGSDPQYIANSLAHSVDCQAHFAQHYIPEETLPFWTIRDFPQRVEDNGTAIPTFITAGYLDNATNIGGGALDLFNALQGPKALWIGWWDHVRGNDVTGGRYATGRSSWFAEATAFLERHVVGTDEEDIAEDPRMSYPAAPVTAQASDGTWRYADALPEGDATAQLQLEGGVYTDDGTGRGSADSSLGAGGLVATGSLTDGVWTFGDPLPTDTHIAGVPVARLAVDPTLPLSNVVVNIYDVAPSGMATMVSRGAGLVDTLSTEVIRMWPTDWVFEEGHRIAVRVSDANTENYVHVPTLGSVQLISGQVDMPLVTEVARPTAGERAPRMDSYLTRGPFMVDDELAAALGRSALAGLPTWSAGR